MKKQTNLHSTKLLSLAILAAVTIIIGTSLSVTAQDDEFRGFKVGRYEGDIVNTTANIKGTAAFEIRNIDRATGDVTAYLTPTSSNLSGEGTLTGKIDGSGVLRVSGTISSWTARVVARASGNMITANYRLEGGSPQAGNFQVTFLSADQKTNDKTVAADNPQTASCQPSDKADGKSQSDIFKRLIIARYEHKPENDREHSATVTFQTFKLGATHKWRPGVGGESPDGPGGNLGTVVYPVKAVYIVCEDYPGYKPSGYKGEIHTRQDENTFYCFKDQFGEWKCNLGEGKMGKIKNIPKQ